MRTLSISIVLYMKNISSFQISVWSSPQSVVAPLRVLWRVTVTSAPSSMSTQAEKCTGFAAPTISQTSYNTTLTPPNTWTDGVGGLSMVTWSRTAQMNPTTVPWWAQSLVDTLRALWSRILYPVSGPHTSPRMELDHWDLWGHFCVF